MNIPHSTISGATHVVGVCGHGIDYTLSPAMHNAAFQACGLDYVYVRFDVAPGSAEAASGGIRSLGLAGVNVTKPLKTEMIPFLDDITEEARQIGSVNTIINRDGVLSGASTDGVGLQRALDAMDSPVSGKRVVILGAGGTARAACAMCRSAGAAHTTIAARNREQAQDTASVGEAAVASLEPGDLGEAIQMSDLIINAVPTDLTVEASWFSGHQTVYDTRYDVADTILMKRAGENGARTANGIDMLLFQGAASFEMWTGHEPPTGAMRNALVMVLKNR